MAAQGLLVSVVIPTHQRRELLRHALEALARQDLPADSFEVIVSIDGSTDGTREMIEAFGAPYALRTVQEGPRRGRAAACNAAIERASGEVLVMLDDDMEPAHACLANHYRSHPPGSRICVVGAVPVCVDATSSAVARYVAAKFSAHVAELARPDHTFVLRDFYSGNASIRRDVLLEVGAFDEAFMLYGNEDLELSMRLREAGVDFRYSAEAAANQHYTKTLTVLAQDTFEKGKTAVLLAAGHPEAFDGLQLAAYSSVSARWSGVRAALLAVTRRWARARMWVLQIALALERIPALRRPLFYRFVLDYFYWAGVEVALADPPSAGPLALLAADLRRGPIGLLLHR